MPEVRLTIIVDEQGVVKISDTTGKLEQLKGAAAGSSQALGGVSQQGQPAAGALASVGAGAGQAATQLLAVAGVSLSIAGAAYLMKQAWDGWFSLVSSGVKEVEDWKVAIIGAAAHMTDMTKGMTPKQQVYDEWKEYFQWLWDKAKEVDKQVSAGAQEIFAMAKEMAKKGVIAETTEQVETLGFLMDKLRSVTLGMSNQQGQLYTEVRALFDGTIRMTSQLAMALRDIDQDFNKNYESARKTGTVFEYLDTLLSGIKTASKDLQNTWGSLESTMRSTWQTIQIEAFADAYGEIVALGWQINSKLVENGKLTEEGQRLAKALGQAWQGVKQEVLGFVDYLLNNADQIIGDIGKIAEAIATVAGWFFKAATFAADLMHAVNSMDSVALVGVAALGDPFSDWAQSLSQVNKEKAKLAEGAGGGGGGGWGGLSDKAPPHPTVAPFVGKDPKGGGGKAGKSPEEEMAAIVKRLEDAITHASLERAAAIEKEYSNWLDKIKEVGAADESTNEAMVTAGRWRAAQMDKLENELTKMVISETVGRYAKLEDEEKAARKKYLAGVIDPAEAKKIEDLISQIFGAKMKKSAEQSLKSIAGLWKQYYDVIAQGDPYSEKTWTARWARLEKEHQEKLRNLTELARNDEKVALVIDQHKRNLDGMYHEDARKLAEEQMQYMGGMYQGMTKAATDYYNESTNMYKQGVTLFNQTTAATETALAGFFEIIIFRTGKFTDVMTNFLKQLSNALLKSLIIQPLVGLISGGLGSLFGGAANSILGGLAGNIGGLIGLGGGGQESVISSAANAPMAGAEVASLAGGYGGGGGGGGGGGNAWLGLLGVGGIGLMAAMMGDNEKGSGGTGKGGSLEKCSVKQMVVAQLVVMGLTTLEGDLMTQGNLAQNKDYDPIIDTIANLSPFKKTMEMFGDTPSSFAQGLLGNAFGKSMEVRSPDELASSVLHPEQSNWILEEFPPPPSPLMTKIRGEGDAWIKMFKEGKTGGQSVGLFAAEMAAFAEAAFDKVNVPDDTFGPAGDMLGEQLMDYGALFGDTLMDAGNGFSNATLGAAYQVASVWGEGGKEFAESVNNVIGGLNNFASGLSGAGGAGGTQQGVSSLLGGMLDFGGWFHRGGIIRAHSGMVLGEDERLVIGQVEEGILPAPSMRRLGRRNFESLRTGDFGQVRLPGSQAGESGPKDMHVHVHVHALDPNSVSTLNWERIVEGKIAPALKKLKGQWIGG